jgi:pantoate--beta-alanine ligase
VRVLDRIDQVRKELEAARAAGMTVGLVPTMGALHAGHRSLIERSVGECDVTLVTVFVNPLQFVPSEDFEQYPSDLAADVALATEAGADLLFAPTVDEMYPGGPPLTTVTVAELTERLEGESRPGHFAGVATVVAKLFALAGPCRAYFGEKDYQQLLVVRRLAADLSFPVEVVGCPTVREPDGLALSSRNAYLSPEERQAATVLHRALAVGAAGGSRDDMAAVVAAGPLARLDYVEIADADTLAPLDRAVPGARLLIAAWVGRTRLIDNVGVPRR